MLTKKTLLQLIDLFFYQQGCHTFRILKITQDILNFMKISG